MAVGSVCKWILNNLQWWELGLDWEIKQELLQLIGKPNIVTEPNLGCFPEHLYGIRPTEMKMYIFSHLGRWRSWDHLPLWQHFFKILLIIYFLENTVHFGRCGVGEVDHIKKRFSLCFYFSSSHWGNMDGKNSFHIHMRL